MDKSHYLIPLSSAALLLFQVVLCHASEVNLLTLESNLQNNLYVLDSKFEYELSEEVSTALLQGIPIVFKTNIQVLKKRNWFFDKLIKSIELRFQLAHRPLTQDYLVIDLDNNRKRLFDNLQSALEFIGNLKNIPIINNTSIGNTNALSGRIRSYLELESLPAPMKPQVYFSRDWKLDSRWQLWEFLQ